MSQHRNFYYVQGSLINLQEMRSRAIFLSSGPNTDTVTIHHHAHGKPCGNQKHDEYPRNV